MANDKEVKDAIEKIKNKKLTSLGLINKSFSDEVAVALFESLDSECKLTELDASRSSIRAHHLLYLPENTCLKKLTLTGCILGNSLEDDVAERSEDEWIKKFASRLEIDTSLTHLCLSSTVIGEQGAAAVIKALEKNRTLQHLDISGLFNPTKKLDVSENIVNALIKMLKINKTLTEIELRFLKLKPEDKMRLKSVIVKREVNLNIWLDDGETVLELKTDNKRNSVSLRASPLVTFHSDSSLPKEDSSRTQSTDSSPKTVLPQRESPRL